MVRSYRVGKVVVPRRMRRNIEQAQDEGLPIVEPRAERGGEAPGPVDPLAGKTNSQLMDMLLELRPEIEEKIATRMNKAALVEAIREAWQPEPEQEEADELDEDPDEE
jgi:hypothetical protein